MKKITPTLQSCYEHIKNNFGISNLLLLTFLLFSFSSMAQGPGSPYVDAGQDVILDCGAECTDLTASFLETGHSTEYEVTSVPFNPPFPFTGGTGVSVDIDDRWSNIIPIPFDFCFFEQPYNEMIIGSNAVISFETNREGTGMYNQFPNSRCEWSFEPRDAIPSTNLFRTSIFGPYMDVNPAVDGSGTINWYVAGAAPNRSMVINFPNIPYYGCTALKLTSQVVLYETTNVVEVYVQNRPSGCYWQEGVAVLGIQNQTGTEGYAAPGRNTGDWSATNEAWRFTPSGDSNFEFAWHDADGNVISNNPTITVCPTEEVTTYTARSVYQNCNGDEVIVTDDVTVTKTHFFTIDLGGDQDFCGVADYEITAEVIDGDANDATFLWSTGETTQSITVTTSGTYSVDVTLNNCTITSEVTINFYDNPIIDLGPDISSCFLNPVVLDASPSNFPDPNVLTYVWTLNGTTIIGATNPTLNITDAGIYGVTVTIGNCVATDEINVGLGTVDIDLGPDIGTCFDQPVILDATPSNYDAADAQFEWTMNGNVIPGETAPTLVVTEVGLYGVTVTVGGCSATDEVLVNTDTGDVDLGGDQDLCDETSYVITAEIVNGDPNDATFLWSTGETTQSITVTQSGTYSVDVAIGNCVITSEVTINFYDTPIIDLGPDIETCFDQPIILDATPSNLPAGDAQYEWTMNGNVIPGETDATLTVTEIGLYGVTATVGTCSATDEVNVSTNDGDIDLGGDQDLCDAASYVITAEIIVGDPNDATFLWSTGETTQSITVTQSGTYSVDVTLGDCTITSAVTINFYNTPNIDLGEDMNTCFIDPVILDATPSNYPDPTLLTYEWTMNGTVMAGETNPTLNITGAGTYGVTVTNGICPATASVNIGLGNVEIDLGPDIGTCFDTPIILDATPSNYDASEGIYEWRRNGIVLGGETNATLEISEIGTYSVTVTVGSCSATDSIDVLPNDDLVVSIIEGDLEVCPNEPHTLTTNTSEEGATYQWFLNSTEIAGETGSSIEFTVAPGTVGTQVYSVVITAGGCSGTDSIDVRLYPVGNCVISQGISPNGDGFNDTLDLTFLNDRTGIKKLQIFNRLGTLVFEQINYLNQWGGQSKNGNDLPSGTYFYVIDLNGNDAVYGEQATGWIYLNREAN